MDTGQKTTRRKILSLLAGLAMGLIICEILLRIYNPSPAAIRSGKLVLPSNQKKTFANNWIKKLDSQIHYSRNSLGFRGPELPVNKQGIFKIIAVGGSTTECKFLSDSCTWPARLYEKLHTQNNLTWVNNAGIDGHTTFGHLLLIKEYVLKIRPDYILLMTGVNDIELGEPDEFDRQNQKALDKSSAKNFVKSLANHTELGRAVLSYYQLRSASRKGLQHKEIDLNKLVDNPLAEAVINARLEKQVPYLSAYRQRIDSIIRMCIVSGIQPVLITQPSLFGSFVDPVTGINAGNKWSEKNASGENSVLMEKILEKYNDVLRSFSPRVEVIDLSHAMPKNSSLFYDFTHVTNEGATKIASLLFDSLQPFIHKK